MLLFSLVLRMSNQGHSYEARTMHKTLCCDPLILVGTF
jgi:hypothetical protein